MIGLLDTWGSAWAEYFGPAVLQNTVFLGLVFLAVHKLKNIRAGLRYALCLIGLLKLLLPPFLPIGFIETQGEVAPLMSIMNLSSGPTSPVAGTAAAHSVRSHPGIAGLIFTLWAAVAIAYLTHTALSALRLRRELEASASVPDRARVPGRSEFVEILKTDAISVPLTFGLVRPKVYVPEAWETWSESRRSMVLAHELAHIGRWDRFGQVLQAVVRALYFFHPLVWLLDRRINEYREMACDDAATENSATEAAEYSRHLVEIAEAAIPGGFKWRSASAFLKQRRGLLDRIRYRLEVKDMEAISARTRTLVFAGFMLLVLPLSWYCGEADTRQVEAPGQGAALEIPKSMQQVTVALKQGKGMTVDGEVVSIEGLGEKLEADFPSDRDNVLVRLDCENGVAMERVSEIHKILVDSGFSKVLYLGAPTNGLPLVLPSVENQEKLARLAGEHVAVVKIDLPGRVVLDGEPMKVTEVRQIVADRLAEDPYLVVSLVWAPTATYEDFLMVLSLVKAAGANRVAVNIGV